MATLEDFLSILKGVKKKSNGKYMAICPFHDDSNPSLSLKTNGSGNVLAYCFVCGNVFQDLVRMLPKERRGVTGTGPLTVEKLSAMKRIDVTKYGVYNCSGGVSIPYYDEEGKPISYRRGDKVLKYEKKRVLLPSGRSGFFNPPGISPAVYGLNRIGDSDDLWIVEGESDCWALWNCGISAVGIQGAGNWRQSIEKIIGSKKFENVKRVLIFNENDKAGKMFSSSIANFLKNKKISKEIKIVNLSHYGVKDPSELWVKNPDKIEFTRLIDEAVERAEEYFPNPIPDRFRPFTLSQLSFLTDSGRPWLVVGFLARQEVTILSAEPGAGKTSLAVDMVCKLGAGYENWLGFKASGNKLKTLYLDAESSISVCRQMFLGNSEGVNAMDNILVQIGDVLFLDSEDHVRILNNILGAVHPDILVVDTLRRHLMNTDENRATSTGGIGSVMARVKSIAKKFDCGVLLIHHTNKLQFGGNMSFGALVAGSSDIRAAVDSSYVMIKKKLDDESDDSIVMLAPDKLRCNFSKVGARFVGLERTKKEEGEEIWKLKKFDGEHRRQSTKFQQARNGTWYWSGADDPTASKCPKCGEKASLKIIQVGINCKCEKCGEVIWRSKFD